MRLPLRFMLLLLAMMLLGFSARAGSITEEQARTKAQNFLQGRHSLPSGKRLAPPVMPRELHSTSTGERALYVFNVGDQNGFVIVAGDDRARPILGYADSGSFEVNSIPVALREMLAIYARQIEMLGQTEAKSNSVVQTAPARHRISSVMADVKPLLTTTWDQGAPYNAYCPTLNEQTALTGCVATAMAQIAYYHKFPTSQVPSLAAYTSATNKINVSAWGATTFGWDNMLNSYSGSETNAQKAAVATLMRYCGQAAQMDYGFTSGAYNGDALYAFKEKLGYNANATFKSAASYSANGWEDLIYKEVRDGRPVYYSALNGDDGGPQCGGHAFVIDGYKANGNYFHVNWGWGGACNGYFNLFALDHNAPESAATATGWHYQMLAIIGLSPEEANTAKLMKDASDSWLITCADDWNELSANLEAYNGGSFKLTADISVTTMVGIEESQPFSGTFDGQGHTLNVNIESNNWSAAPFSFIGPGTNIKNLKVTGTVSCSSYHSSGMIGMAYTNDNFPITINGCEVAVEVNGNDYAGGFIGHARCMQPVFTDCIFSGSINGCHDHGCFVGWKEWESRPVYVNCLSIPTSFNRGYSCDFSHPGNGGSADQATLTNCYSSYTGGFGLVQGISLSSDQMAEGLAAHGLQAGSRDWTTGLVWGQQIGTDLLPVKTSDASKAVHKVSFELNGQVIKTVFTNSTIGNKMPAGEDFGLANATFTCNGSAFTSTTPITSDITVTVTGTYAFTLTLATPDNGSISINNNTCLPGILKKITAIPANGYVVSAVTVTDAAGKALPVTKVSNATNEFVFAFPKSSVTVNAEFITGTAGPTQFINGGMTLPSSWRSGNQHWTADTWTIWGDEYNNNNDVIVGTPPTDALGHKWYEEGYMLTNSDTDVLPNNKKIVWENHAASFKDGGNYDYFRESGSPGGDRLGDFYIRRIFTFNTATVPTKLYLSCSYDDSPVEYYINGTLVYQDHKSQSWHDECYEVELTPSQIALIHTDGTPNVLAVHSSQNWGGYHLDCGLYDPNALSYEVIGENTLCVLRNEFITGDVVIPETVTYNGITYTVTELPDEVTNDLPFITSLSLPSTISSIGTDVFFNLPSFQYLKSYIPVYQNTNEAHVLMAAPLAATEYEVAMGCTRIWNNAFKFTENLKTLTLPRTLTEICDNVFIGCTALTDIYSYARPVPQTSGNAFDGLDKSKITVHVYASALDGYKQSWGEDFQYVTIPDPQSTTLTINVTSAGSLRSLIEEAAAAKGSSIFDVTGITVTGTINQDDLSTLSAMCTGVYSLTTIDLSGAAIEGNYIGDDRFRDREKLTSIILPETLEYINNSAFRNCDGLTSIDIPASVKSIWHNAFYDCSNLSTVTGMEGLSGTNLYEAWDVFGCTAITQPLYSSSVFIYLPPSMTGEYEVPAGIKMTTALSMRWSKLSSISLPASLTDLGDNSFQDCSYLQDIYCYATTPPTCHNGVWDDFDRSACTVHVPASAVEDYQNADEWCDMGRIVPLFSGDEVVVKNGILMYVPTSTEGEFTVPEGVNEIADNAFDGCSLITKLVIGSEVTLHDKSLYGLSNTVEIVACQNIYFDQTLYAVGTTTTNYTIPEGCATIHPYAFKNSAALTSLTTQSLTVIKLQENSLTGLSSSVIIYVYESMLEDYKQAWGADYDYRTITDPEIGSSVIAFSSADGMWTEASGVWTSQNHDDDSSAEITASLSVTAGETISLDWSVSSEGDYDWLRGYWNDELILEVSGSESGTLNYSFKDTGNGTLKFVYSKDDSVSGGEDCASIATSLNAVQVGDFTLRIGNKDVRVVGTSLTGDVIVPESFRILGKTYSVVAFEKSLFYENKQVTFVTLPSTITSIPAYAFYGCEKLANIDIPTSVKFIGSYAFAHSGLTSITIPNDVTGMGDRGLQDCTSLTSITLGSGLKSIPDSWAEGCRNLEKLIIGKRLKEISWYNFRGASIKQVVCYAKTPPTWYNSYNDALHADAILHVYSNSVNRYQNANGWKEFSTIVGDLGTYPTYDITVNVATMGTFSDALATAMTTAGCEDMMDISKLTVTGSMNSDDLNYLHDNMGGTLDALDLGAVTLENNMITEDPLGGCWFETLTLPASLEGFNNTWGALENCVNLKTIDIPSNMTCIRWRFLNGAASLETVTGGDRINCVDHDWCGPHFDGCPNLKSPVIFGNIFFRLPISTNGAYEVPDNVTTISCGSMWKVAGLTALTLPESITAIHGDAFVNDDNLKDIYYYAIELPYTTDGAFNNFDRSNCTLHVYEEMVEVFQNSDAWNAFKIVGDLGTMPVVTPMNESDFADLCAIYNTLDGANWKTSWIVNKNVQTASRWRGVTFDSEGFVTSIDLSDNLLSGDISSLAFTGLTKLTSLNLSSNAITGDIQPLAASLPNKCTMNVERQEFGDLGEFTLYEICRLSQGLPTIAFYNSQSGTLASTLIGVGGHCQFYHEGTNGGQYWDSYIYADGNTTNNFKFHWPSPATIECLYPHHFTFTYKYEMGDANMDDALNVLDLQTTLNYSNGQEWGLFNFYAADTYGPDNDINVQDIVSTVNILLALENNNSNAARSFRAASLTEAEAYISVENGQIVLYTTKPVAALDLQLVGIKPDMLSWNTETLGFTTAATAQKGATHAIIYSLQPRQIVEGRTVIATFDENISPNLVSAVLSDSKARQIRVGKDMLTGICQPVSDIVSNWSLTNLSGISILSGTNATEADILKLAKSQQLHGIFILNMDGTKRKIMIK